MSGEEAKKAAIVGVVGRTNAGKSTLVNLMVGEKVSIVSPVEQTTRNTIRGIVCDPRGQLVLLDTPGLHKAEGPLGRLLNSMARASSAGVDVLLVVFDAAGDPRGGEAVRMEDRGWMARVAKEKPAKVVFALNKSDLPGFDPKPFETAWAEESAAAGNAAPRPVWVTVCGVREDGCADLMDALFAAAEPGPPLFDEDVATDYPRRLAIADVVREKLIRRLFQEIPHEIGVAVREIEENDEGWFAHCTIYVNKASQKGIVIGKGGRVLRDSRRSAQRDLAKMFGLKVRLALTVKVEPHWMANGALLEEMGYRGARI